MIWWKWTFPPGLKCFHFLITIHDRCMMANSDSALFIAQYLLHVSYVIAALLKHCFLSLSGKKIIKVEMQSAACHWQMKILSFLSMLQSNHRIWGKNRFSQVLSVFRTMIETLSLPFWFFSFCIFSQFLLKWWMKRNTFLSFRICKITFSSIKQKYFYSLSPRL